MNITREDIIYNKALIAKSYFNKGKFSEAHDLIVNIELETTNKSEKARKTMTIISEMYNKLGLSMKAYSIYHDLKDGKWGTCEEILLDKIKPDYSKHETITKFAPPPEEQEVEEIIVRKEKVKSPLEAVILARFYIERKNSRYNAYNLLCDMINSNNEKSFDSRKAMFQAAQIYDTLGISEMSHKITSELKEGKWGECEPQILDKLNKTEKKELWSKTKEVINKVSKPLPEFTIPSILMMKF